MHTYTYVYVCSNEMCIHTDIYEYYITSGTFSQ